MQRKRVLHSKSIVLFCKLSKNTHIIQNNKIQIPSDFTWDCHMPREILNWTLRDSVSKSNENFLLNNNITKAKIRKRIMIINIIIVINIWYSVQ